MSTADELIVADERRGLPSASRAHRWINCAGSHLAEARYPREESEAAAHGTLLHAVMDGTHDIAELTPDDREVIETTCGIEIMLREKINTRDSEILREARFFGAVDDKTRAVFTARIDKVLIADDRALIIDYKFGVGEVEPAQGNLQLLAAAALVCEEHPEIKRAYVAIIQPRAYGAKYSLAEYHAPLDHYYQRIAAAAQAALKPDAPRTAGEWCRYCRAAADCPVARERALSLARPTDVAALTADQLRDLLDACEVADEVMPTIRAEAVRRLREDANALDGWQLPKPTTRRTIADTARAWDALEPRIGADALRAACTLSIAKIEKAFASKLALAGKVAREQVAEALGDTVVSKTSEPSKPERKK